MSRASHGASTGCYYYEVEVLCCGEDEGTAAAAAAAASVADKYNTVMQDTSASASASAHHDPPSSSSAYLPAVRVGFSMRTAELQAPVGYDKWSYAYRSVGGSRVHKSERDDDWGGEPFGKGDVVGCAICLAQDNDAMPTTTTTTAAAASSSSSSSSTTAAPLSVAAEDCYPSSSHIRFYRNGRPMGNVVVNRGKYSGGEAYDPIAPGVYYPAVSGYMGGRVRANFGPKFMYPPTGVPAGLRFRPFSDLGGGWKDVETLEQQLKAIVGKVDLSPPQANNKGGGGGGGGGGGAKVASTRNKGSAVHKGKGSGSAVERDDGPFKNLDAIVAKLGEIVTARIENMRWAAHLDYSEGFTTKAKGRKN